MAEGDTEKWKEGKGKRKKKKERKKMKRKGEEREGRRKGKSLEAVSSYNGYSTCYF